MPGQKQGSSPDRIEIAALPQTSPEAPPSFGERIPIDDDPLLDHLIRGEVVIFGLKLPKEPAGQIAENLRYDLFSIFGRGLAVGLSRVTCTDMVYSW